MKKTSLIIITILMPVLLVVISCEKNKDANPADPSITEITGTYNGEFVQASSPDSATPGKAVVTIADNSRLTIHCVSEDLDTTFMVDAFDDGDSVMVCYTGQDFSDMYGHMESDDGHMMMNMGSDETEWMHHLEVDHKTGDTHPGGFDKTDHTFFYNMPIMYGNSEQQLLFKGVKE